MTLLPRLMLRLLHQRDAAGAPRVDNQGWHLQIVPAEIEMN
jgi:hypothetical protein